MKVLTIRQPWAELIIDGFKSYEFRSWKTNYRGKILIHAGKNLETDMVLKFKDYNLDCPLGAIIGEAYLEDCILVSKNFNDDLLKKDPIVYGQSNHAQKYAWKLTNVKKYDHIIPVNGKLGLWNYK
jgi:predicted transcriptional regulator